MMDTNQKDSPFFQMGAALARQNDPTFIPPHLLPIVELAESVERLMNPLNVYHPSDQTVTTLKKRLAALTPQHHAILDSVRKTGG